MIKIPNLYLGSFPVHSNTPLGATGADFVVQVVRFRLETNNEYDVVLSGGYSHTFSESGRWSPYFVYNAVDVEVTNFNSFDVAIKVDYLNFGFYPNFGSSANLIAQVNAGTREPVWERNDRSSTFTVGVLPALEITFDSLTPTEAEDGTFTVQWTVTDANDSGVPFVPVIDSTLFKAFNHVGTELHTGPLDNVQDLGGGVFTGEFTVGTFVAPTVNDKGNFFVEVTVSEPSSTNSPLTADTTFVDAWLPQVGGSTVTTCVNISMPLPAKSYTGTDSHTVDGWEEFDFTAIVGEIDGGGVTFHLQGEIQPSTSAEKYVITLVHPDGLTQDSWDEDDLYALNGNAWGAVADLQLTSSVFDGMLTAGTWIVKVSGGGSTNVVLAREEDPGGSGYFSATNLNGWAYPMPAMPHDSSLSPDSYYAQEFYHQASSDPDTGPRTFGVRLDVDFFAVNGADINWNDGNAYIYFYDDDSLNFEVYGSWDDILGIPQGDGNVHPYDDDYTLITLTAAEYQTIMRMEIITNFITYIGYEPLRNIQLVEILPQSPRLEINLPDSRLCLTYFEGETEHVETLSASPTDGSWSLNTYDEDDWHSFPVASAASAAKVFQDITLDLTGSVSGGDVFVVLMSTNGERFEWDLLAEAGGTGPFANLILTTDALHNISVDGTWFIYLVDTGGDGSAQIDSGLVTIPFDYADTPYSPTDESIVGTIMAVPADATSWNFDTLSENGQYSELLDVVTTVDCPVADVRLKLAGGKSFASAGESIVVEAPTGEQHIIDLSAIAGNSYDIDVDVSPNFVGVMANGTWIVKRTDINGNGSATVTGGDLIINTGLGEAGGGEQQCVPFFVGQYDYSSNTYSELGAYDLVFTLNEVIVDIEIALDCNVDSYPGEVELYIESPANTVAGPFQPLGSGIWDEVIDLAGDFAGENSLGTWKVWIEDTYGDGGCAIDTDTCLSINYTPPPPSGNTRSVGSVLDQYDYSNDSYDELGYETFDYSTLNETVVSVSFDIDAEVDSYPSEVEVYIESPMGTLSTAMTVGSPGNWVENFDLSSDFAGENAQGTWILRVTDTYGDGGCGINLPTQITIN